MKQGLFHGISKYYAEEGKERYVGESINDSFEGFVTVISNNTTYYGEFSHIKKEGYGIH